MTAKDAFGNVATGYDGAATLTCSDGQTVNLLSPCDFAAGTASVMVALDTAATVTLKAVSGPMQETSGSITVNPCADDQVLGRCAHRRHGRHWFPCMRHRRERVGSDTDELQRRGDALKLRRPAREIVIATDV